MITHLTLCEWIEVLSIAATILCVLAAGYQFWAWRRSLDEEE